MPKERTLVLLKPDCLERHLVGTILQRYEQKGLQIAALKVLKISQELAREHYACHKDKPFFQGLVDYISLSPTIALVLQGLNAISIVRNLNGATDGHKAAPGSIRGDFSMSQRFNLVHGSDSLESAQREISLFFRPDEIVDYDLTLKAWK